MYDVKKKNIICVAGVIPALVLLPQSCLVYVTVHLSKS